MDPRRALAEIPPGALAQGCVSVPAVASGTPVALNTVGPFWGGRVGWAQHTHTHVSWGGFRTNERQKDRTKERREDKRQADRQADREERQKERKNHDRHKSSKTHRKEGFPVGTSRIVQNRSQQFPGHPPLFIHASVPACLSRGRRLS